MVLRWLGLTLKILAPILCGEFMLSQNFCELRKENMLNGNYISQKSLRLLDILANQKKAYFAKLQWRHFFALK